MLALFYKVIYLYGLILINKGLFSEYLLWRSRLPWSSLFINKEASVHSKEPTNSIASIGCVTIYQLKKEQVFKLDFKPKIEKK